MRLTPSPHSTGRAVQVPAALGPHLPGLRAGARDRGAPLDLPAPRRRRRRTPDRVLRVLPRHHHLVHLVHFLRRLTRAHPRALPGIPGPCAQVPRTAGAPARRPGAAGRKRLGRGRQRRFEADRRRGRGTAAAVLGRVMRLRGDRRRRRPARVLAGAHISGTHHYLAQPGSLSLLAFVLSLTSSSVSRPESVLTR